MQDEEKKPRKPRRSKEEIAADYERRVMRIRYAGKRDALEMIEKARALLEEATAAAGIGAPEGAKVSDAIYALSEKIQQSIPAEAR